MTKVVMEITKIDELSGDKFFTLKDGNEINIVCEETLVELIYAGHEFFVDVENEQYEELSYIEIDYMEVIPNLDDGFGTDVYYHMYKIIDGGVDVVHECGKFVKEYKNYKQAVNFANRQNVCFVVES